MTMTWMTTTRLLPCNQTTRPSHRHPSSVYPSIMAARVYELVVSRATVALLPHQFDTLVAEFCGVLSGGATPQEPGGSDHYVVTFTRIANYEAFEGVLPGLLRPSSGMPPPTPPTSHASPSSD